MISKFLNALGIIAMLAVILVMIPLTLPKLMGLGIYGVQTSSMTPLYCVGGVIYVKDAEAGSVKVGDIITYKLDDGLDMVETHRVMEITDDNFITKGDNNSSYDPEPVRKDRLVGKPVYYIPYLGLAADHFATLKGKLSLVILFLACLCLWVVAELIKPKESKTVKSEQIESASVNGDKGSRVGTTDKVGLIMQMAGIAVALGAVVYIGVIGYGYLSSEKEYDSLTSTIMQGVSTDNIGEVLAGPIATGQDAEQKQPVDENTGARQEQQGQQDKQGQQDEQNQDSATYVGDDVEFVEQSDDQETILDNLQSLQRRYPVIVGWIVVNGTDISYPIVHSDNNETYLRMTYAGEKKTAGSIFMESVNNDDFMDSHTIIYGHNMRNGSMFGGLKEYKEDPDFYEAHKYITVYTGDEVLTYEIFAYSDVDVESPIYRVEFTGVEDYEDLIREFNRRSYRSTELAGTVVPGDKVLTLSTCSTTGKRFIVNAKLVQIGRQK